MKLKQNIGTTGRLWRFAIGVILLGWAIYAWSSIALLFGLFSIYEALAGWCLMMQLLGKSSCSIKK